jgi:hypothetical protein
MPNAHLHNFIIYEDRSFDMDYIFSTVEEEMEVLCITLNRDAPLGMSFLPVVLLSRMMSSRLFPAFCTQERQSWNT